MKSNIKTENQTKESELFQLIGRLQIALE
ncbi:hypothetical protein WH7805_07921 [Synechococcus sp. WH 7805]|nr:hypothetical protein WH7805_07921 [Synechococcus sp. WH 7805]